MKKRWLFLLVLFALPGALAASANTVTVADNQTYVVDTENYTVHLGLEDAVLLDTRAGTKQILRKDACLELNAVRSCLKTVSDTTATFSETLKIAVLTATHQLDDDESDVGQRVGGSVSLVYSGVLSATDAVLRLTLPDGIALRDGSTGTVLIPIDTVRSDRTIAYDIIGWKNGSYSIGGQVEYFDGNTTVTLTLKNDTLSVITPVTFSTSYDSSTGADDTQLKITVKRVRTENFTVTITAILPPEANITSVGKGVDQEDNTLSDKKYLNGTETGLNATYNFRSPPSAELQVLVTYKNSTDTYTIGQNYSYDQIVDDAPALAVSVDPMLENRTGTLRVIITGNRTGNLSIEGTLLNKSMVAKNDTYEFALGPAPKGLYAVKVSFTSISPYGTVHVARGVVSVEVKEPKPAPVADTTAPDSAANQTTASQTDSATAPSGTPPIVWIGVSAALVMLILVLVVVKRFSDPVAKLEVLVDKIAALRAALEQSGQMGARSSAQYKELERLERKLTTLQRKL